MAMESMAWEKAPAKGNFRASVEPSKGDRVEKKPSAQQDRANSCPLRSCQLKVDLAAGRRFGAQSTDLNPIGPLRAAHQISADTYESCSEQSGDHS